MDSLTYRDDLCAVLVQSSACRDVMREAVAMLAVANLPSAFDEIVRAVIERLRAMTKTRFDAVIDLIILPGLPQRDRHFTLVLANWTKLERICIPKYMRTYSKIFRSADKR